VYDGNKYLQKYRVNARDAIPEFADVGGQVQAKLLGWPDIDGEEASNADEEDERDSVLGPKSVLGDTICNNKEMMPLSWSLAKSLLIPECVKNITFTIDEANMSATQLEELKTKFPDVLIQSNCPPEEGTHQAVTSETDKWNKVRRPNQAERKHVERPKGVKNAIFELYQRDMDKDPQLAIELSKTFPWATLQEVAISDRPKGGLTELSSHVRIPKLPPRKALLPSNGKLPSPDMHIVDLATSHSVRHLCHLATNVLTPPSDNFLGYRYQISEGWDLLSPDSKVEIAHARCIMAHYGEDVTPRCTSCTQHGYSCRVYRRNFSPVPHLDLGHGCQHCRVWGQTCDLPTTSATKSESRSQLLELSTSRTQPLGLSSVHTLLNIQESRIQRSDEIVAQQLGSSTIQNILSFQGSNKCQIDDPAVINGSTKITRGLSLIERMSKQDDSEPAVICSSAAITRRPSLIERMSRQGDPEPAVIYNSAAITRGPSLIERMSRLGDPEPGINLRIRGLAAEAEPEDQEENQMIADNATDTTSSPPPSSREWLSENMVYHVAEELGFTVKNSDEVQTMYNLWYGQEKIRGKGKWSHDDYYDNLLALSIIGHHTNDPNLQYQVLLKWQEMDYKNATNTLPDTSIAVKAFQYLPGSALCQWITIVYSFLWHTAESGDYETFCEETKNEDDDLQLDSIAAFLHSIVLMRCAYTKGDDMNVLRMWCDVHNHARGGLQEEKCIEFRDRISNNLLATRLEQQADEALDKAKELITTSGGHVILKTNTTAQDRGKPTKRKSEASLEGRVTAKKSRGR